MKKKKLLFVFGTRPEALKMAPVIVAAKKDSRFSVRICFTGQHREMAQQVLDLFKIKPDHDLNVMRPNQSLALLTERLMNKLDPVLCAEKPDVVLVQGDTTSAFVGALAAYYHKIPVAHIEAGLRSFDKYQPFPEELNRAFVGKIAEWNFAPTKMAAQNLRQENTSPKSIYITGNTVVDALQSVQSKLKLSKSSHLKPVFESGRKVIAVTTHRRENFGKPLVDICHGILELAQKSPDIEIAWLLHLNPLVQNTVRKMIRGKARIHLLPPLGYLEFLTLMEQSYFLISDSGGVQEEAPSFHKPVLVLRNVTERPEGIKSGVAKLVGTDSKKILRESLRLLNVPSSYKKMSFGKNPYGDGKTSARILDILARSR